MEFKLTGKAAGIKLVVYSVLCCALVISASVQAGPIVIKDYGGTATDVPSAQALRDAYERERPKQVADIPPQKPINPFPVRSHVQPGVLNAPVRLQATTPQPLFILGPDALSLRWFERNKQYLLSVRATGYATNVESQAQLNQLNARLAPLSAVPLPLDEPAQKLGIPVYPVLIIGHEIKQ
jgi:integrating conjugative element protein (TIGR03765 family)